MKQLLMITCLVAGLAGVSVAQTAPATTTAKTEKTSTKGTHKHSGKHKAGAHHHKATKQAK